jgi:DNA polymerase-1
LSPHGLDDVELHLVDDFETASELIRWLGTEDAVDSIAVDTETTGLVRGKDHIRLAQVGGFQHGWAIPWEDWRGLFKEVITKYSGRFDMHNAKFDHGMLRADGVDVPTHRIDDTRVMSHILEPHMSGALKSQTARHIDALAAGAQGQLGLAFGNRGAFDWATVPLTFGPYWQYAALDTVLTRHLKARHAPIINEMYPKSYDLENGVQWVIENMEVHGVHIDVDYARDHKCKFDERVATHAAWIKTNYNVGPGGNAAIVKILQDAGFKFNKQTASGAISLDKEVLAGIDHPLAQTVLSYRQHQKLSSTYLSHFIDEVDSDSNIHPSINTLGARTGRMSMERPNLQNLPRRSESNPSAAIVRNCVIAREGHRLILCDFGQIEMRLLAAFAGCTAMIDAFRNPDIDFFVNLARQIFDDTTLGRKDPRRQITKNGGYATIYGASVPKFSKTAGIDEDRGRAFFQRWNALYPEVKRFQDGVSHIAWQRQKTEGLPYAVSPVTGRRFVADANKVYALVNYLIQGTAAEIFKMKILQLDAAGLGPYMLVPVHDEIILDVPKDDVNDVVHTLTSIMNDDTMLSVPITASIAHGERWGMKTDWVEDNT